MKPQKLLNIVLEIGMQMLINGAEVSRVEDTITRICVAYGIEKVDVFTITSSIIVTIQTDEENSFTQTKRVKYYETNLEKVDRLNSLSRYICKNKPDYQYVWNKIKEIEEKAEKYPLWLLILVCGAIAGVLAVFFGGDWADFIVSGVIGAFMRLILEHIRKFNNNSVFINAVVAFIAGTMAVIAVYLGIGHNIDKIVTANIMLLIQGVMLTNSMRDMINGDTMSGMLRFIEAIVGAVAVALGSVLATVYMGGMIL